MSGWAVTLPYPPSENAYRTSSVVFSKKRKKMISLIRATDEAKQYKAKVALLLLAVGHRRYPVFPRGEVDLTIRIYRPQRSGDTSNRIKVLEDALKGYAWTDDAQVRDIVIRRREDPDNPRAEVEVHPVPQAQGELL